MVMEMIKKKQGIILKEVAYKNSSILWILSDSGIDSYQIKGLNKGKGSRVCLLSIPSFVDFVYQDNKSNFICEINIIDMYTDIKEDFDKISVMYLMIEKVLALSPSITDFKMLISFISGIFKKLSITSFPTSLRSLFEIKLLFLLGIGPVVKECAICNKTVNKLYFSIKNGGVVCSNCCNEFDLDEEYTNVFKLIYLIKAESVNEEFLKIISNYDFSNFLENYYASYLDFISKTNKVISTIN